MDDQLLNRRQLMREITNTLAAPLEGTARERFLASAENIVNRDTPAPGRAHMAQYLRANIITE